MRTDNITKKTSDKLNLQRQGMIKFIERQSVNFFRKQTDIIPGG